MNGDRDHASTRGLAIRTRPGGTRSLSGLFYCDLLRSVMFHLTQIAFRLRKCVAPGNSNLFMTDVLKEVSSWAAKPLVARTSGASDRKQTKATIFGLNRMPASFRMSVLKVSTYVCASRNEVATLLTTWLCSHLGFGGARWLDGLCEHIRQG